VQSPQPPVHYPPPRRRLTTGKVVWLLVLLLLIGAVLLLAMTGLVPGVSRLVGATSSRNLGVTATRADFSRVVKDLGYQLNNVPEATDPARYRKVYSGQVKVDREITQEELSALLTFNHVTWWPMQNVQVKVHADGAMEVALEVLTNNISFENAPSSLLRYVPKALPDVVPVYIKGRLDVVGPKQVRLDVDRLELGRIPLPSGILSAENQQLATDYVNGRIRGIPGLTIEKIGYQDGKVQFKGTFPKEFKRLPLTQ